MRHTYRENSTTQFAAADLPVPKKRLKPLKVNNLY